MVEKPAKVRLSAGEMELMSLLWERGPVTLSQAHREFGMYGQPIGYPTIQTRPEPLGGQESGDSRLEPSSALSRGDQLGGCGTGPLGRDAGSTDLQQRCAVGLPPYRRAPVNAGRDHRSKTVAVPS